MKAKWYEIGKSWIKIKFHGNELIYVYNSTKPGRSAVAQMKQLAAAGRGLSTFVSQNVRQRYARTEKNGT